MMILASLLSTGSAQPTFASVCTSAPWSPRLGAFTVEWSGGIWILGGMQIATTNGSPVGATDVWGSYDLGRTWKRAAADLPGGCSTTTSGAKVYNGRVYLFCSGWITAGPSFTFLEEHGTNVANYAYQSSYYSSSPDFSAQWTTIGDTRQGNGQGDDGLHGSISFTVDHMAVPFDGIGTLVLLDGLYTPNSSPSWFNDIWTFSASTPSWSHFLNPSDSSVYLAPWNARAQHSTTTDAEGLVLIMTGGTINGDVSVNDVWQMSWTSLSKVPLCYRLTDHAPFPARKVATLVAVHDWLFIYGGSQANNFFLNGSPQSDDVWGSSDYGTTWSMMSAMATGTARHGVGPLAVSRRWFIIGGSYGNDGQGVPGELNDVWVTYW
jgi:hypothetical protein